MPPKKLPKKSGFKVKLAPEDEEKKRKIIEEDNRMEMQRLLAIKAKRETIDGDEEERIRIFLHGLQKTSKIQPIRDQQKFFYFDFKQGNNNITQGFKNKIKDFMYDEIEHKPNQNRILLFSDILENLNNDEIKDVIIRYLAQDKLSFQDVYKNYLLLHNQEDILRQFLTNLNDIYNNADIEKQYILNISDEIHIKKIKKKYRY